MTKDGKFPFGPEGPPNKKQKRPEPDPSNGKGYLPAVPVAVVAELKRRGLGDTDCLVFMALLREYRIEFKGKRPVDRLRVPPIVRDAMGINPRKYLRSLVAMAAAGVIKIVKVRQSFTAEILIDIELKKVITYTNTLTGEDYDCFLGN